MNQVVERIEVLRRRKGITQKDLAKAIGISKSAVYKWGKSSALPSLENIENVCKVFGITTEQFFNGIKSENSESKEEKFLDEWRMLSVPEKLAVEKVIAAFKAVKGVQND